MISKHLVPNTKEFCAVLNLSHPIGRFECCVPNTSHRLRHCLASLLGHGPARAQFMKHEETIDFVEFSIDLEGDGEFPKISEAKP